MSCTKISRHRQLNAMLGERKLPVYRKLFHATQHFFKMDPSARKLQEPGNNQNELEENLQNSQIMYTSYQ